jgi:hypothetical protein
VNGVNKEVDKPLFASKVELIGWNSLLSNKLLMAAIKSMMKLYGHLLRNNKVIRMKRKASERPSPQERPTGVLQILHCATFDCEIDSLIDQIGEGLREDDATNFEKLNIARTYGPLLIQLKAIVPHGQFKIVLKERFPKVSYAKCNRWMVIARRDTEVAEALVAYSDIAWGPKKMFDYLTKEWRPEIESEEDEGECCESDISTEGVIVHSEISTEKDRFSDEESDDPASWERFVAKAESEAQLIGTEPVIPTHHGTVIVTVFSEVDHDVIADALAQWQPKTIQVFGRKEMTNLTATVSPEAVPDILMKLGKTLRKTLPTQLKLCIDL